MSDRTNTTTKAPPAPRSMLIAVLIVLGSAASPLGATSLPAVTGGPRVDPTPTPARSIDRGRPVPVAAATPGASHFESPTTSEVATIDSSALQVSETVAATARRSVALDPFGPITSPDIGEHCAPGLGAHELTDFFAAPIGAFQGADYQRALRLADDRVLWTFQDAFVAGTLVHNVGMIQSGRCFTMLNDGPRSWLMPDTTSHMSRWHWILDGGEAVDGTIHLFVVEMVEQGSGYLSRTTPTTMRRVVLDGTTLEVVDIVEEPASGADLYGWAVTDDTTHTYLYSHCYRQFGHASPYGFDECAADVKLARLPVGQFDAPLEYWNGSDWTGDAGDARPVVDASFVLSGNNPAQVRFDGDRYLLVEKRDDWWGSTVEFGVADEPFGPFEHVASIEQPLKCDASACNTYFAAWLPWVDRAGDHIWSIGHNRWNGAETARHLDVYRPTFHTITL